MAVGSAYFHRKWTANTRSSCQIQGEDRKWLGRLPVCVRCDYLVFAFLECSCLSRYHAISVAQCFLMLSFLSLFLNSRLHQALLCDLTCLILCFPFPRQQKKQSILLAFTLLFALLFTLSMFVQGNGVLECFFYCLFWDVKNDSGCLSASFVDAVQMCLLVADGCCCSGTCSTASDGCTPLINRFSNVLFLCSDRHPSRWPSPQTDTNLWSPLHLLPGSTYDSPFTWNPSELSEVVCFPALNLQQGC